MNTEPTDQDARLMRVVDLLRDEFLPASEVYYTDSTLLRIAKEVGSVSV